MIKKILILFCFVGLLTACNSSKSSYSRHIKKQPQQQYKSKKHKIVKSSRRDKNKPYNSQIPSIPIIEADTSVLGNLICPESAEIQEVGRASKARAIIDYAKTYMGTNYRYGGMSSSGIDCSGLVYLSFLNAGDIELPRRSQDIAREGQSIPKNQIRIGDLVFFKTNGSRVINHIGIVVENSKSGLRFIHSSTSRGVMISGLNEQYWKRTYQESRRIL